MINKIFKLIHNKYSRYFKFIFFLRYLLSVFFIFITLILIIPNFFDYKKQSSVLVEHVFRNYHLKIDKFDKIEFQSLPSPRIKFKNVLIKLEKDTLNLNTKDLIIYPKLFSIYNFKNFKFNKLILNENKITLEPFQVKNFFFKTLNQEKKIFLKNLDLNIANKNQSIIKLKNVKFSNYGYKKNFVTGDIFNKKFKLEIKEFNKNLKFTLLNSGINLNLHFKDLQNQNKISGILKSKILNNNLKFDFDYDYKKLNIYNSYFRSKNISFKNNSRIIFEPFFDMSSNIEIEEINKDFFKMINFNKLLKEKDLIKKINIKNDIKYEPKKFEQSLIDQLSLKIDLAYGRLIYQKKFSISGSLFKCSGDINFLEDYPLIFFDCSIISEDKKKLFKTFSIKIKNENEIFKLYTKGSLSLINKKINFKNISVNENYNASDEDLKYFKDVFEEILYSENFLKIFNKRKIKKFILEVI